MPVRVPSDTNQEEAEATAERLLLGLPLLSPSPECEAAIKPFMCLYLFGSCDSDNQPHQVTQADCVRMRDDVCAREWALAIRYLGQGVLPECGTLLNEEDEPPKEECGGLTLYDVVDALGPLINQDTMHGSSYTEKCTELPVPLK